MTDVNDVFCVDVANKYFSRENANWNEVGFHLNFIRRKMLNMLHSQNYHIIVADENIYILIIKVAHYWAVAHYWVVYLI